MNTTSNSHEMITFKRTHFYSVLAALAFAFGLLLGYFIWGRSSNQVQPKAEMLEPEKNTATQILATQIPLELQAPQAPQAPQESQTPLDTRFNVPTDGFPSIGPENAPIVFVEFSDFQCPYCKRFYDQAYQQLQAAYPGKIRFVFRNLPLISIHEEALPAAEASMCANDQNSFWEYHDKIFENQGGLGRELYMQIAKDLNLDVSLFENCLTTGKNREFVQRDMKLAINLGVKSTPTFFINGLKIIGSQPFDEFKKIIDKELAEENTK